APRPPPPTTPRFPYTTLFRSPAHQHVVHRGRAPDRLRREWQLHRGEDERLGLRAAEPAVEGDQLLEGAGLLELGVVEAVDHDVRSEEHTSELQSRVDLVCRLL